MGERRSIADLPRLLVDTRFMRDKTLRQVGDEMGISAASLNRFENGSEHTPDLATLTAIASWLGLEIALLPRAARTAPAPRDER